MYTSIIRYALTLTFCTFALGGWAVDLPFSEDFNTFKDNQRIAIDGWSFKHCLSRATAFWPSPILTIQTESNKPSDKGYAITPPLNYTGEAILSFTFCATTAQGTSISISVSNGTIEGAESVSESSSYQTLTQKTYKLTLNQGATITFALTSEKYAAIDDIIIVPGAFTFSEANDNTSSLISYYTKTVTVNTHRTLLGGIWNTLCLPFDVSMADLELALGKNQDIQVRTFHSYDSATKVMTFVNPFGGDNHLSAISAGTPFLIKLNSDVENPTFHAVTISNIAAQSIGEKGSVQFVGTYSPVELAIDGTNIFITRDNTLALPAEGKNTMNGLRAYIVVPKNFNSSGARLLMDDGETASVSDLAPSVETGSKATYNLNGQRVENVRRGLYVVNGKLTLVK